MFRALAPVLAAAAFMVAAPIAGAQVPADVAAQLRALGRVVDTEHTGAIYAPLQPQPPFAGVAFERDLKYGPDPKENLDVARPTAAASAPRPVLVFVHGGAYVGGDKSRNGKGEPSPFSDNIMVWAAGQGMVGVNINYRLAPGAPYPAVQQDIAEALVWVRKNIARYGGDPKHVFLWGHSAGASHVAAYVAHPEFYPGGQSGLSGAIMSSGTYDLTEGPQRPSPYFGDPATFAARSSKAGLLASKVPLYFAAAELDPPPAVAQEQTIRDALCAQGHCPAGGVLKDHSHMSESYSVGTADQSLTAPLLAFIKGH